MNSKEPMTFEEWIKSCPLVIYGHEYQVAKMSWQASQAQQASVIAELVEALEDAHESLLRFTSDEGSTQKDFDTCDHVHSVLAKVKGK